jgi:ubiquinone/menaquinone biosynthesis C-methylase UbiE
MLHYFSREYDTKERFCSYWHQIDEILSLQPDKLLEVGKGNGFVHRYLQEKGLHVTTLDILPELKPSVVGTILSLPFANNSFNAVMCCEVLEHLPYSDFSNALKEIHRVSQRNVVLSLPDHTPVYKLNIELPRIKPIKTLLPHPFPRVTRHEYDGVHYWVIGKKNYQLKKIKLHIEHAGFKIQNTYRVFEFYGHRVFILLKV